MKFTKYDDRRRLQSLPRKELRRVQARKLRALCEAILPENAFYREKFAGLTVPPQTLDDLATLPFTYKEELMASRRHGELCRNQTFATDHYVRLHQTSGTRGRPMVVLDTAEDWQWWMECWQYVLDAAEVESNDRVFFAFSFGPFIGFWSAHDACLRRGCLVLPGGGMSTLGRIELMRNSKSTVLFCTPSYALHMAEVGAAHQVDVGELEIRVVVLAGEPGGSIPSTRRRIEECWQATVVDHAGATEIGPWGIGDRQGRGIYINEAEFLPEFISVSRGVAAEPGELAELVLTNLGRYGCPIVRYRTGDLVKYTPAEEGFTFLEGGIHGRADDMVIVRGVNVFPGALEQIVRGFPEVIEFRVTAERRGEMDYLSVEVEDRLGQPERIAEELRTRLGLKIDVTCVGTGTLPRFEGKGKRFVDLRYETV